ncbi:ATP-dependent Clp protease proteolytic subunit [Elysia marginata]|uniref:ATP-dependent Clp protease proteolytic subunit n=1 Tax=Elysia marginata TaxID=1093978 RepID=A0AAV4G7D6_9GAST|nr:ATP-dependent Clp protease proteolytic subunit [Elysia marginata]
MEKAHIYIYGEISSYQSGASQDWGIVNLTSVKEQVDRQKDAKEIVLHIHSVGGDVSEGFAIYDFLKSQGKPITAIIEGNCFSVATVVALSSEKRKMTSHAQVLIHNPWGGATGDKEHLQNYAKMLSEIEDRLSEFYASKTNLNKEEALELMAKETFFNAEECLKNGFANEVLETIKAVALFDKNKKIDMHQKENSKEEIKTKLNFLAKGIDAIQSLLKTKSSPKNIVLQDANGTELDFPDLEEGKDPKLGDKATVNNAPAEGEFVMPNGDTYIFEIGELKEIKEAEKTDDKIEALKKENEKLKEEIETLNAQNKTLNAQNKILNETSDKALIQMKKIAEEFNEFKKNISSSFEYSPAIEKNEDYFKNKKNRKIFK